MLFVGRRDGLGVRARDWKAGEIPGEDRVRRLCDAAKEELTRGAGPSAEASARCAGLGRVRGRPTGDAGGGPCALAGRREGKRCWAAGCWARRVAGPAGGS